MKQATGNNRSASENDVSIQLKLGGHSFSADTLTRVSADGNATLVVETHKATLVPEQAFDPALAEHYLAAVGLPCADNETAVYSPAQDGTRVVMAVARKAYDAITERFGSRVRFTSPLFCGTHDEGRNISIRIIGGTAYIRVFDGGLQACEAVSLSSDDDVLYYALRIGEAAGIGTDAAVYISGCKSAARLLKRYFRKVICE